MGCPNPNCDGELTALLDFGEQGCGVTCSKCPFREYPKGYEEKCWEEFQKAEENVSDWLNTEAKFDIDWEQWEAKALVDAKWLWRKNADGSYNSRYENKRAVDYWTSRGIVFKEE